MHDSALRILASCGLVAVTTVSTAAQAPQTTYVSRAIGPGQTDRDSLISALSADGRSVAFRSMATNSVPDDTNGQTGTVVDDRRTAMATGVTIVSGAVGSNSMTTSNSEPGLIVGGKITGRVTDAAGNGLPDVNVYVYLAAGDGSYVFVTNPRTDSSGNYSTPDGLLPGTYYLETLHDRNATWGALLDEVYDNVGKAYCPVSIADCPGATPVTVVAGATTSDINFVLEPGGQVSGKVTDAAGTGLPGVQVAIYGGQRDGSYLWISNAYTGADGGYYSYPNLPTGTVYARTYNTGSYIDVLHDGVTCLGATANCSGGKGVNVTQTLTTFNVDFVLAQAPDAKNDAASAPTVIPPMPSPFENVTSVMTATTAVDDPTPSCGTQSRGKSVWFMFTAPASGQVTALTTGSSYSTIVSVYTGTPGSLVPLPGACVTSSAGFNGDPDPGTPLTFAVTDGASHYLMVTKSSSAESGGRLVFRLTFPPGSTVPAGDYDEDGKADVAVFRPSSGIWYELRSSTATGHGVAWGIGGDKPVAGDYDGDGVTDAAVFRPSSGTWYVLQSTTGTGVAVPWGVSGDLPVPADYDGDGKTDVAVWRPSSGVWFIIRSTTNTAVAISWGLTGDTPVPADFDGDGHADPTVFRPSSGTWYELRSTTGVGYGVFWGQNGDVPVAGDYDGDGKADTTVFRASTGTWYELRSSTGTGYGVTWGTLGDIPIVGDYDGDGKADPTVFRPSTNTWYELRSTTGVGYGVVWGATGDLPQ